MTEITALAVVQKALASDDLEEFVKLWDPDGVWTHSGSSRISGPHSGHWEITEMARLVAEVSGGTLRTQSVELVASGEESVLGYFHLEAQRPGAKINQNGFQRWVVRDGKILSLENVYCDQDEIDKFFE